MARIEFGYYPDQLDFSAGDLSVLTLPVLMSKTADVMALRVIGSTRRWLRLRK